MRARSTGGYDWTDPDDRDPPMTTERAAGLREALRYLRGLSDDLADAVLDGVQPGDVNDADWAAATEGFALLAAPVAVDVERVTRDMAAAMPWYDDSQPDYTDAENVLRAALAARLSEPVPPESKP